MAEPYCLAMVLCDGIHRDAATSKMTILGTFSTIALKEFPARVLFFVYFAVTDGMGPSTITLKIKESRALLSDENGGAKPFDVCVFELPVEFADPLVVIEAGAPVPVEFPRTGQYHCELYAHNQLLMARRLMVIDPMHEEQQ